MFVFNEVNFFKVLIREIGKKNALKTSKMPQKVKMQKKNHQNYSVITTWSTFVKHICCSESIV